jgi:hypothetical protein
LSEWLLLRDTFAAGHLVAGGLVIFGLTVTFIAIAGHTGRVLFGHLPTLERVTVRHSWSVAPALLLVLSFASGLVLAPPVMTMLAGLVGVGVLK